MTQGGWSNGSQSRVVVVVGTVYSGLFFYDPAPGPGTLIGSWTVQAGQDPYGNNYPQGIMVGTPANASQIVIGETGGSPLIYFPTGRSAVLNSGAIQTIVQGAGTGQYEQVQMLGPEDNTQLDAVDSAWLSSSPDGTQDPQILDFYHDPSGGFHFYRTMSFNGNLLTGVITAPTPGTGTSRANPATNETWHSTASLLSANWTTTGVGNPLRYRVEPIGTGRVVRLDGQLNTAGAGPWPGGGTILTLPTGYQPTMFHSFVTPSAIDVTANAATVQAFAGGAIKNGQTFTGAGQDLFFDGITFPLD